MKWNRWIALAAVMVLMLLMLPSCGFLAPSEQQAALAIIDQMLLDKIITPAQHAGLSETIMAQFSNAPDWGQLAGYAITALGTYFGLRLAPPKKPIQREVMKLIALQNQKNPQVATA